MLSEFNVWVCLCSGFKVGKGQQVEVCELRETMNSSGEASSGVHILRMLFGDPSVYRDALKDKPQNSEP